MHKCEHSGCKVMVEDSYHFCYNHRKDKYIDTCKIHGKQEFILGVCQKCKKLKKPIYRIYYRNKNYYRGTCKTPLPNDYYLKPYFKVLTSRSPTFHKKFIKKIVQGPGIYGIFVRNKRRKDQLGDCLYVGQSISIKNRIAQHKKNFVIASNHLSGLKSYYKNTVIIDKFKVESKYYKMCKDYYLKDLKFVTLYQIPKNEFKKYTQEEQKELLTFLEQHYIDIFKPKLNLFAARPSY